MTNDDLIKAIERESSMVFDWVKKIREHIHMFPELSFKEIKTSAYVVEKLKEIGINDIEIVSNTGVVALISNDFIKEKKAVALRADLDALPILEENEKKYSSVNKGIMHACGHDVHTAVLLGASRIIFKFRQYLRNPVKLIFQPGEEVHPGGASILIEQGVLENPKVERIYALHVYPELETGKIGVKSGTYMASSDELHVQITGKGGHGALPEKCINPIEIGSEIILQSKILVQNLNTKNVPTVISFGSFIAEGATNVIPNQAFLKGTFRTMDEDWREEILLQISNKIQEIGSKYGGSAKLIRSKGYPCLFNNIELMEKFKKSAIEIIGDENIVGLGLRMTAEDFAFYSMKIPACFFRLGVGNEKEGIVHSVHHPKFDVDPRSMQIGMKLMASIPFTCD